MNQLADIQVRPHRLPYKAKDGVFETYFREPNSGERAFTRFVDRAISWSKQMEGGEYCLLDTFLSDTLSSDLLEEIIRSASDNKPSRILLADPYSGFAVARAKSIGELTAESRCKTGLQNIISALRSLHGQRQDTKAVLIKDLLIEAHKLALMSNLEIKFYSVVPSGPMLFLHDILLCGNYCAGWSSKDLPWSMVIDDPNHCDDMYDIFKREFDLIWKEKSYIDLDSSDIENISGMNITNSLKFHSYFLSYCWENSDVADHIEVLLHRSPRQVYRDESHVKSGDQISSSIKNAIDSSETFVALWSVDYKGSSWCPHELEYALDRLHRKQLKRVIIVQIDDTEQSSMRVSNRLQLLGKTRDNRCSAVLKMINEEEV